MESESHGLRSAAARHKSKLYVVVALTGTYLVAEVVGSIITGSLALLADAGFMFTDLVALSLALVAIRIGERPAGERKTFGYARAEVLAALVNAILMGLIFAYILYEAYQRFQNLPEVLGGGMMAVAAVGLGVNLVSVFMLREASKESINLRGAYLEVLGDMLGSVAVIVGGLIIMVTGWRVADPLLSVGIALFILPRAWSLLTEAVEILMESTPRNVDLPALRRRLESLAGIVAVHDLHAWTITTGMTALSAHLVADNPDGGLSVLEQANAVLSDEFGIAHTTLQVETPGFAEAREAIHA